MYCYFRGRSENIFSKISGFLGSWVHTLPYRCHTLCDMYTIILLVSDIETINFTIDYYIICISRTST